MIWYFMLFVLYATYMKMSTNNFAKQGTYRMTKSIFNNGLVGQVIGKLSDGLEQSVRH